MLRCGGMAVGFCLWIGLLGEGRGFLGGRGKEGTAKKLKHGSIGKSRRDWYGFLLGMRI